MMLMVTEVLENVLVVALALVAMSSEGGGGGGSGEGGAWSQGSFITCLAANLTIHRGNEVKH